MCQYIFSDLGGLLSQAMLLLYSTQLSVFNSSVMYNFVGAFAVMTFFMVYFWMKDVILEKEFDERRESTRSSVRKVRFGFVLKQAGTLLITEPLIALSILGGVIQYCFLILGNGTSNLAIDYVYEEKCASNDDACVSSARSDAQ
jgi:hypothetical protein